MRWACCNGGACLLSVLCVKSDSSGACSSYLLACQAVLQPKVWTKKRHQNTKTSCCRRTVLVCFQVFSFARPDFCGDRWIFRNGSINASCVKFLLVMEAQTNEGHIRLVIARSCHWTYISVNLIADSHSRLIALALILLPACKVCICMRKSCHFQSLHSLHS